MIVEDERHSYLWEYKTFVYEYNDEISQDSSASHKHTNEFALQDF